MSPCFIASHYAIQPVFSIIRVFFQKIQCCRHSIFLCVSVSWRGTQRAPTLRKFKSLFIPAMVVHAIGSPISPIIKNSNCRIDNLLSSSNNAHIVLTIFSVLTRGWPNRTASCTSHRPSLNSRHRFLTRCIVMMLPKMSVS